MKVQKTIYAFDSKGTVIDTFDNLTECASYFNLTIWNIKSAIRLKGFTAKKYYFSYDKNFKRPIKLCNHNDNIKGLLPGGIKDDYYKRNNK